MKKKELIKFEGSIYRVIAVQDDEVLLIDCIKRNMPKWWKRADVCGYDSCSEDDLLISTGMALGDVDKLDAESSTTMH